MMKFDPETHQECLGYIRTAISSGDPNFVNQILTIIRKTCNLGCTTVEELCDDLTPDEKKQLDLWHKRFLRWHSR